MEVLHLNLFVDYIYFYNCNLEISGTSTIIMIAFTIYLLKKDIAVHMRYALMSEGWGFGAAANLWLSKTYQSL